jgi:hypothetical protein
LIAFAIFRLRFRRHFAFDIFFHFADTPLIFAITIRH